MSDEEAQFGTESPDPNDLVDVPGPSQKKGTGKGGKPKGENNARAIQHLFAGVWDMIPLLTKLFNREETDCKAFAVIGL